MPVRLNSNGAWRAAVGGEPIQLRMSIIEIRIKDHPFNCIHWTKNVDVAPSCPWSSVPCAYEDCGLQRLTPPFMLDFLARPGVLYWKQGKWQIPLPIFCRDSMSWSSLHITTIFYAFHIVYWASCHVPDRLSTERAETSSIICGRYCHFRQQQQCRKAALADDADHEDMPSSILYLASQSR